MAKSRGGTGRDRRNQLREKGNTSKLKKPIERGFSRFDVKGRMASRRTAR